MEKVLESEGSFEESDAIGCRKLLNGSVRFEQFILCSKLELLIRNMLWNLLLIKLFALTNKLLVQEHDL